MKSFLETARAVQPTRRQAAVLALTGLAATTAITAATAAGSDIRTVTAAQRAADQQTLLNLINAYRAQNGLGAVKHSATVASVMEGEAIRQFKAGYFSHGTEFIYNAKVQGYSFVREVIALSTSSSTSGRAQRRTVPLFWRLRRMSSVSGSATVTVPPCPGAYLATLVSTATNRAVAPMTMFPPSPLARVALHRLISPSPVKLPTTTMQTAVQLLSVSPWVTSSAPSMVASSRTSPTAKPSTGHPSTALSASTGAGPSVAVTHRMTLSVTGATP